MRIDKLLRDRRDEILRIAAKHGARNVRLFGSAARGDAGPASDLDFLVEMEEGRSLLDLVGLSAALTELLGRKVDVCTDASLHWFVRDRILAEAVDLERLEVLEESRRASIKNVTAPAKDDQLYLICMLEYCDRIQSWTRDGRDAFLESELTREATYYRLGTIGRMARKVSEGLRRKSQEIPWSRLESFEPMTGLDNRFGPQQVWEIVERELPDVQRRILAVLGSCGMRPDRVQTPA